MLFPDDRNLAANGDLKSIKRLAASIKDNTSRFLDQTSVVYAKQFAPIYASRLDHMRDLITKCAIRKWGTKYPIKRLCDLEENNPNDCIVIGTLVKHQTLKPSILKELSEETQLAPQPARFNFAADDDLLILEDELQRIRLDGDSLDVQKLVTGIVCAVLGYEHCDGKFLVKDHLFYESGPQPAIAPSVPSDSNASPLLVLVSGLDQSASNAAELVLPLELLQQWLYGNLPDIAGGGLFDREAASVVRVIVAGNSVRSATEVRAHSNQMRRPESIETLRAVQAVDAIMHNWTRSVPVDLMPGEFDPTNFMLPQQPMHPCMFAKCSTVGNFRGVTNPYDAEIDDRRVVGTSGQNVDDIMRYSRIEQPLEALRCCLRWSHLAPTCPDTLPCYPFNGNDPFVLDRCPHVLFAGNAPAFASELHVGADGQRTRLVCVPAFGQRKSVAVVNLRTLDCKELTFALNDE